jgi:hypothetical protein
MWSMRIGTEDRVAWAREGVHYAAGRGSLSTARPSMSVCPTAINPQARAISMASHRGSVVAVPLTRPIRRESGGGREIL